MVWEVRPAGSGSSDLNGGGFKAGATGVDRSQQDAHQTTYTDLVIDGAVNTNVTSAANPFGANDVGNVLSVTSAGTAVLFASASSQYLSSTTGYGLSANSLTVACWVRLTSKAASQSIAQSKNSTSSWQWQLWYDQTADRFSFRSGNNTTSWGATQNATTFGSPSTGTWYFLLARYNRNGASSNISICVNDGAVDTSANFAAYTTSGNAPFRVGRDANTTTTLYMDGRVDSLGIWAKAASSGEVTALYNSGNGLGYNDLPGVASGTLLTSLSGWWDFEELTAAADRKDALGANTLTANASPAAAAGIGTASGFAMGRYEVVSVAAGAATLDRQVGQLSSTGGAGRLGGAVASPGLLGLTATSGNKVWIKSGTYDVTRDAVGVAGGRLVYETGSVNVAIEGYGSTRGDMGTRPHVRAGVNIATHLARTRESLKNIKLDTNGFTVVTMADGVTTATAYRVETIGGTTSAITNFVAAVACKASDVTGFGIYLNTYAQGCEATTSSATASDCFRQNTLSVDCISSGQGQGNRGFFGATVNCTAYNHATNGYFGGFTHVNSLAVNCTGYGFPTTSTVINCAGHNNTSGNYQSGVTTHGFIDLSAGPFTNAGTGDFSLNSTSGGGAALRAAGYPGAFLGGTSTGYPDVGAVQHQDSGGGGGGGGFRGVNVRGGADQ